MINQIIREIQIEYLKDKELNMLHDEKGIEKIGI